MDCISGADLGCAEVEGRGVQLANFGLAIGSHIRRIGELVSSNLQ